MEVVAKILIEVIMFPVRVVFWMIFATLRVISHLE